MKKLFINQNLGEKNHIELKDSDYNHVIKSLRKKVGDILIVTYIDFEVKCVIKEIDKNKAICIIIEKLESKKNENRKYAIIPLLKEKRMKILVEKLTEIGIDHLLFFNAENSIVKIKNKKKLEKYFLWIKEASQQCGRKYLPKIDFFNTLESLEPFFDEIQFYLLDENGEMFDILKHKNKQSLKKGFILGPEGSFSKNEKIFFSKKNVRFIKINSNILRAETAGILGGFILTLI